MKKLVCYAHFDGKGQVRPFVQHALQMIRPCCADLVFVSNSPLTDQDQALLAASATHVIVNNNTGYDFYMWKLGLESVDLSLYDEVILMNSSVFGPLFTMEPVFSAMAAVACDFWGITECFQMQPHIQSYFLVFRKAMVRSEAFRLFWNSVLPYTNKLQVIQSYEVGLTQWFVESGFRAGVYCCFEQIGLLCRNAGKRLRRKDNTSVKFALELLQAGSPFLKRDAVRNRKVAMDMVMPLLQKMGYPTALMTDEEHHAAVQSCPVCGTFGRLWRRGVKNFISLHDTERYDYLRCTSKACGIVWLKDAGHTARFVVAPEVPKGEKTFGADAAGEDSRAQSDLLLVVGADIVRHDNICESPSRVFLAQTTDAGEIETMGSSTPSGKYDTVILKSCLEEVRDPCKLLKNVYCYLKPGGMLYVETLNADSVVGVIFKGYWSCLRAPYVRHLFSDSILHSLLVSSGYESIEVVSQFSCVWQSVVASFEAIRNKRISPVLMPSILPLNKALNRKHANLLSSFIPSWGETLCAVARRVKGV